MSAEIGTKRNSLPLVWNGVVAAVVVVVVDVQQQGLGLDGLLNQLLLKKGRIYRSSRFQFPTL